MNFFTVTVKKLKKVPRKNACFSLFIDGTCVRDVFSFFWQLALRTPGVLAIYTNHPGDVHPGDVSTVSIVDPVQGAGNMLPLETSA